MAESLSKNQEEEALGKLVAQEPIKKPPPENPQSIRLRTLVITSFWIVVILLGLPVWLWTTSIHRARLPLQDMLAWADGKACKPTIPLQIAIEASSLQDAETHNLIRITQHALDDLNEFSAHHLRLRLATRPSYLGSDNASTQDSQVSMRDPRPDPYSDKEGEDDPALTLRLLPQTNAQAATAELQPHSTVMDVYYGPGQIPMTTSSSSTLATFIATKLKDLFAEEQAMIAYTLSRSTSSAYSVNGQTPQISQSGSSASRDLKSRALRTSNPELSAKIATRMTRSLKYAPTFHITISLFTPSASPSSWHIESAIAEYFAPLLNSLSTVSNFTVDTQVQLHATLSPSVHAPEHDTEQGIWTLREEDLSGFINAAEWPLSPSIGAGPTLNFVIYIPEPTASPLVVKGSQASSWLVPQWGGVAILNPQNITSTSETSNLPKEIIRPALLTFSHQLLAILGAPQTPPSLPLQLQTLTRVRAASLLLSASSTMGSLARLTVALPSIAIPETVSSAVDTTLLHLRHTCSAMKEGRFKEALENARTAEAEAERGFFEKSMVGQVYFPDEHKVAVYLPLLGPVGVPLVMSGLKECKRWWSARKKTVVT